MLKDYDQRRKIAIPGDHEATIAFAAENFVHSAARAIQQHGKFSVALSGGSTPKAIFARLALQNSQEIDWSRVYLFWSDERAVPENHPDSNYKMAMESGFNKLQIPPSQIFRMKGEGNLEKNAEDYEQLIKKNLDSRLFDLVMLGLGEDGHTASLFPKTAALEENKKLVVANFIPEKNSHRLTLTFNCINQSERAIIYAIGKSKEAIVPLVLKAAIHSGFPASTIGTAERPALWILDHDAARLLTT